MYCEECKEKPATVHLTQMFDGKKVEIHLCEECAAKKGVQMFAPDNILSIPQLLGSFFGSSNMQELKSPADAVACPNCGMRFLDIKQTGKLGCSECYTVFERNMEPILRRIHGNSRHIGRIPARGGEKVLINRQIRKLKSRLQEAVANEEYEKAAEIRDSIKEIEKKIN
jgi:protein arginine kinase activator